MCGKKRRIQKFFVTQIPVSKYELYPNDNDFIQNYEYGYYQTLTHTSPYMFFGAT